MRFRVQYFSRDDDRWYRVAAGGDSGYLSVGKGRQAAPVRPLVPDRAARGPAGAAARPRLLPVARRRARSCAARARSRARATLEHRRRPRGLLGVDLQRSRPTT